VSYARVIPVQRTPLGVEGFDYLIPEELSVQVGSFVRVPFRKGTMAGVAESISTHSSFAHKALPIKEILDITFPESFLTLLAWTASRTFCSKPTVLKAWLRWVPKRHGSHITSSVHELVSSTKTKGILKTHWVTEPEQHLIARAKEALAKQQRILIVVPWKIRAEHIRSALGCDVLHSDLSDGEAFKLWRGCMNGSVPCLITTRLGAWLAPFVDLVLLDEPENDDHKQDELAPRYDARLMLMWCHTHLGTSLETFGLTPPLHVQADAPTIPVKLFVHPFLPNGRSPIPCIQANTYTLLITHCSSHHPLVIIHPIRGTVARPICRDCGWRGEKQQDVPLACPTCGGTDFSKSWPGIEKLKLAWMKHEPHIPVEWRNLSNEDVDTPFSKHAMVVITDGSLLSGVTEDVRRLERCSINVRRLADHVAAVDGTLIIQTSESLAPHVQRWLTKDGVKTFREQELQERRMFGYPPATRLVKILEGKHKSVTHILFPPSISEKRLIELLTPLATSAIIDLDPIAFLK